MKVAYLINQYPMPSQTFIRREIRALEAMGMPIGRYSVRSGAGIVVDGADIEEMERTRVVLDGRVAIVRLVGALTMTAVTRPGSFARAFGRAVRLGRRSKRGLPLHLVYLAEACVLRGWFEQDGIGHVHCHFGTNGPMVALLCRALGGPSFSFTVHGPEEFDDPVGLRLADKARDAAFIVAISSFGRSQLYRWLDHRDWSKVEVVRCGLDESFLDTPTAPIQSEDRLVCVGRLGEQKGQMVLVNSIGQLVSEGRAVKLTLAGEGPMRASLEAAMATAGIVDAVTITGWLDNDEVRAVILGSRAVVLPSFAEGLPVALMEALALRRPVVTTSIAGIPELVDDECGWLVPAGSAEALTDALRSVLDAELDQLDRMGEAGRQRVLSNHDASREAAKLAELFSSLTA